MLLLRAGRASKVARAIPAIVAIAALALTGRSAGAGADVPPLVEGDVTLEYRRGAGASACPDESELRERAADTFEFHDPFVAQGKSASSHLRIEIARANGRFRGKVIIVDDAGKALASSTEEHADCDALVWVLAHRVALVVLRKTAPRPTEAPAQASAAPSASAIPVAPEPVVPPAAPVVPAAPAPNVVLAPPCDERCMEARARRAQAEDEAASDPHVSLLGGALMTAGWTADVGPGVWAGFAARHGWLSIGFEVRSSMPSKVIAFDATRSASASAISGLVVPCARWKVVSLCGFFEAGTYLFFDPGQSLLGTDSLISAGPRAAIEIPLLGGVSARAFADLALHPYRPVFLARASAASDAPAAAWVSPLASGLFGVGLVWSP